MDVLECHVTWFSKELLIDQNIPNLIECLSTDIQNDSNDIEVLARPFMAFLYTQGDEPDLDRALEEASKTITLCRKSYADAGQKCRSSCLAGCDRSQGYELVALSNKAHILLALNDDEGLTETMEQIKHLTEKKASNDVMKAGVLGMHGFALSYIRSIYRESLGLFREAEDLNPGNYYWPLSRGVVAGRLLRREKHVNFASSMLKKQLDLEQEESIQRAVELTNGNHCGSLLHLAELYYWRGRGNHQDPESQNRELLDKAKTLYLKVYGMRPNCPASLKRIGKAFLDMGRDHEPFAEQCLLKAEKIDPQNSMLLHRLGQFYEHAHGKRRNLKKAETYYKKSVTSGPSRNVAAEMDLGRVRQKLYQGYDLARHLTDLLEVYPSEEHQLIIQNRLSQLKKAAFNRSLERYVRNMYI